MQNFQNTCPHSASQQEVCRKAAEYAAPPPSWPSEQPVIVMPPGSDPISVGMPGTPVYPAANTAGSDLPEVPQNRAASAVNICSMLSNYTGECIRLALENGTGSYIERLGILKETGGSYLVLRELGSQNLFVCRAADVKFFNIYQTDKDYSTYNSASI